MTRKNWPKGDTIDGENKIVLFHGPINDSKTDVGYIVSSNSFTEEMFDGFDMDVTFYWEIFTKDKLLEETISPMLVL